tara:strand:+ start:79 stop:987 length:909 start_codon:yes stop_codon:yes gene_type:complete
MKKIIFIFIFNALVASTQFDTVWGKCNLINNQNILSDSIVQKIILSKISNLNNQFKKPIIKKKFSVFIDDGNMKINNKHWHWSLGITYSSPEKIIIKDPSFAHISINRFEQVLLHELNHIMMNRIDFHKSIPRWFKEGFALYFSDEISLNHKLQISKHLYDATLFNLESLDTFSNFDKQRFNLAYAQSAVYVLSIQKLFGDNTLQNIYNGLYSGKTFNDSFYDATTKNINEYNQLAYPYIKNKYKWYKLITLPNQLFSFLPLLLIVGFILRSIQNKKIKEKWELEEKLEIEEKLENSKFSDI